MSVYLAGGINGLSDSQCSDWRTLAKALFACATLDPMRRDYRGREDQNRLRIVLGDLWDILRCGRVLVNAERASWGTAMEIVFAWFFGCRIVAFTSGRVSPWLWTFTDEVVGSLPEAVESLKARGSARPWGAGYLFAIVFVNWIFGALPYPYSVVVGSAIVGSVLILRDVIQQRIGHRVIGISIAGVALSYLAADPQIATASALAFAASEATDYAAFVLSGRRPFRERVIRSSVASVPVDTIVFLAVAGFWAWPAFALQCASKFSALALLWLPRREPRMEVSP